VEVFLTGGISIFLRRKLTMNLLNKAFALFTLCVVTLCALPTQAQNPATWGSASGRYGLSAWAINNQRVASQYNYDIDSTFGGNAISAGAYTFPIGTCTQALAFGGGRNLNPFNANASIRIIDIASGSSETVTPAATPVSYAGGTCTINFTPANTHTSFRLRSGTCGLREALNDLGGLGGEVIVDQKFYDDGCTATTITGLTLSSGAGLQANQYIHDISAGQDTWYGLKGTSLSLTAAPTALTTAGGAAATLQTAITGGSIATGQAIRAGITCVDAIGRESALSTDSAGTAVVTTGAGSTNSITVTAPGTTGCPNSVGYRLYLSANSGASLSEILYAPTSAGCTAAANSVIVTACALTSNSVVTAIITGTAGIPMSGVVSGGSGATAVGYLPFNTLPPTPGIQTVYGPFPAITTVTTVQNAAEVVLPAGFFNNGLLKTYRLCAQGNATAAAVTLAGTFKVTLGPRQATGVQTIDNVNFTASTIWPAAAANWSYCTNISVEVTGASGQFRSLSDTGFIVSTSAAAAPPAFGPQLDSTTALSTAQDISQQLYLNFLFTASASSWTTLTVQKVTITPVN
jgi:hypothetical protein